MRALIIAVALLGFASTASAAKKHFDTTTPAYEALPEDGRAFIEKLATAVDGGKVNALVALFPADAYVGDASYTHDDLKKAIKKYGGVVKAFGVTKGAWTLEQVADAFDVHRGEATAVFTVSAAEDGWRIRGVADASTIGIGTTNLLHLPEPIVCSGASLQQVKLGKSDVSAGLDKAIVRRYIKRNISKVQYCYEKQLLAKPELTGTVSASYEILPDGKVQGAQASGVDAEVASCIQQVLARIEYPKPVEGTEKVTVSYEFVFGVPSGGVFDTADESCAAMPRGLVAFAGKVAIAYEGEHVAEFVAALAAKVEVFGKKLTKKAIKKEIAKAEGLAGWVGLSGGSWSLESYDGVFTLQRTGSRGFNNGAHLTLKKAKGGWRITAVVDPCAGALGCGGGQGWGLGGR
jgi:hypothetical protein